MMRQQRLTGRQIVAAVPAVVAAALLLLHPAPSAGFGTVTIAGQHAEHEQITRAALACASATPPAPCFEPESITNLAGGPGTYGAVGSPDSDEISNPDAHCDDGDYFAADPNYRRTQAQATQQLEDCWTHLKGRVQQAVVAAARLLDDSGRIRASQVDIRNTCTYYGQHAGQAKCDVLEGLGRDLHGTQDFYSHSNWADTSDPNRHVGIKNPPGLDQPGTAPFLNLRVATPPALAPGLMTGCFKIAADFAPGNPDSRPWAATSASSIATSTRTRATSTPRRGRRKTRGRRAGKSRTTSPAPSGARSRRPGASGPTWSKRSRRDTGRRTPA